MKFGKTWNFNDEQATSTIERLNRIDAHDTTHTTNNNGDALNYGLWDYTTRRTLIYPRTILVTDNASKRHTVQPDGAPYLPTIQPSKRHTVQPIVLTFGPSVPCQRPLEGCIPFARVRRASGYASDSFPRRVRRMMDATILQYTSDMENISYYKTLRRLSLSKATNNNVTFYHIIGKKRVLWERPVNYAEFGQIIDFVIPTTEKHKKEHVYGQSTVKAPSFEQSTSDDAKKAVAPRYFTDVEKLALRCTIGAVKNAIAPRGKNIGQAQQITRRKKEDNAPITYYDETLAMCVTEKITLPKADGDKSGTYTTTLRNVLYSLQRFAHSEVEAMPDNADAQDLYQVAITNIYQNAKLLCTPPEIYITGKIDTRLIEAMPDGEQSDVVAYTITRGPKAGQLQTGTRAVYAMCSASVSTAIRGEKKNVDRLFSVDHISQGSDFDAPEKYDIPDFRSISKQQAKELGTLITTAIKSTAKTDDDVQTNILICNMLIKGYTQAKIAESVNHSQSWVAKRVDKLRLAIASVPDIAKNARCAVAYTAYSQTMEAELDKLKKAGASAEQIRKTTHERQLKAEKAAQKAISEQRNFLLKAKK